MSDYEIKVEVLDDGTEKATVVYKADTPKKPAKKVSTSSNE